MKEKGTFTTLIIIIVMLTFLIVLLADENMTLQKNIKEYNKTIKTQYELYHSQNDALQKCWKENSKLEKSVVQNRKEWIQCGKYLERCTNNLEYCTKQLQKFNRQKCNKK